jgi:predicted nucleic acid-binding protein
MVLIASLDPDHALHRQALDHLRRVSREEIYVPSPAVLELDLELKSHGLGIDERQEACSSLLGYVGEEKILPLSFEIVSTAAELEHISGYFDALIGSTALAKGAGIISKDRAFNTMGIRIEW